MIKASRQDGFIALISAIVISALLLAITFSLGLSGYFSRFNTLNMEFKKQSAALAEACGDSAILTIAESSTITTPSTLILGNATCTIYSVVSDSPLPGQTTIKTQGAYRGIFTNFSIVASSSNMNIISWEEVAKLP